MQLALFSNQDRTGWTAALGALLLLCVLSVSYPPYSAIAVIAGGVGIVLLFARPDLAFALFFAAETLISEDILLINEQLKPTLYYFIIPGVGLNPFEVGLAALAAATILHRKGRMFGTRLDGAMAAFGAACALGYLTCILLYGDPGRLFEPRRLLHFFLAYFLTVNLIRTKQSLQLFLLIFFAAISLKAIQGVYLYTLGEGLQIKWKIRALFTGWGDSLNFVTLLLLLATFVLDKAPLPAKRLWLIATPVVLFSFLFSYKRAYYVAFVVGLFVLFLIQKGKARFRFLMTAFVGFLLFLVLITAAGQWRAIGMRFESILNPTKESSANYRLVEWQNALISIRKNPVAGLGLGGVMPMEIYLSRTNLLGVHNTYLWVAVKMGAVGLFAYLFLQFAFVKRLLRQNQTLHDPFFRTLSRGLTCAFAAFCAAQMFAPMFAQMRTSTWFGVILGIGMLLATLDQQTNAE